MEHVGKSLLKLGLCALFVVLLVYHPLLFGQTLLFGDNYSLMVPGKLFTASWLAQGIVPLWNPLIFAGISWIGDINQSVLYPSTWLFVWLSPALALNLTIVVHLVITFVGMVLLSKRLGVVGWAQYLAAVLWTFAPQLTGSVNNLSTIQSLSWMPWVVWAGLSLRKPSGMVVFVMIVTLQLWGGYPQHLLYSVLLAVALSAWQWWEARRGTDDRKHYTQRSLVNWLMRWAVAGMLVMAATAFIWLPFYPTLQQSTRAEQSAEQAAAGSLQLIELVKVLVPTAFDAPTQGMKWGPSWNKPPNVVLFFTWFGLLVTVLALTQRKLNKFDIYLLILMGIAVLIALGDSLPTFAVLQHIPILNAGRGMSTILMIPALLGPILIARWVCQVSISPKVRKILTILLLVSIGLSLTMWLFTQLNFDQIWLMVDHALALRLSQSVFHTLERDQVIVSVNAWTLLVLSTSLLLSIWLWSKQRYTALLLVLTAEMAFVTQGHLYYAPQSIYDFDPQFLAPITAQMDTAQYRLLTRNYNSPYTDFGAYWDAMSVRQPFSDSYIDSQELANYSHLVRMRDGMTPNWNMVAQVPVINGYTTLLPLDIHRQFSPEPSVSINNLPQIMLDNAALARWSVRYYLVDTWFPDYNEPMPPQQLATAQPFWTLYEVPGALARFRFADGSPAPITNLQETPNKISFSIDIDEPASLLVADRYTPDWRVTINQKDSPLSTYEGLRRLQLTPGQHAIQLEYRPQSWYQGIGISTVTWLGMLAFSAGYSYFGRRNK